MLLSLFFDIISFSVIKKEKVILSIGYFLGIFGIGLIFFKSVEKVTSSGEVSEGSIVLRVFNESSAEISTRG